MSLDYFVTYVSDRSLNTLLYQYFFGSLNHFLFDALQNCRSWCIGILYLYMIAIKSRRSDSDSFLDLM